MLSRPAFLTFILSTVLVALADPVPLAPSPGAVFNEGSPCTIQWTPDTTGVWKTLDIELMTGDNINMQFLTTVASVDGTASPGTFSYPCPAVTLHSAVYFYQFSSVSSPNHTWTGRFAIADSTGATVAPPNPTQPDGEPIPWGTGALSNPASAVPAPPYLGASSNTTTPTSSTNSTAMSSTVITSSTRLSSSSPTLSTPSTSSSETPLSTSAASSSSNSAGGLVVGVSIRAAQAGVALSVIAATFTFLF